MKPEQTRGEIIDLYEKTRAVLGGTWVVGAQTWFECSSREGVTGAHFDFESERRDGELPASAKDIAEQVRRLWASQGIHASTWIDTGRRPYQHWVSFPEFGAGSESDGYLVQFVASDGGQADFSGSGRCAEGNAYDLELAEPRPTPEPPATPTRFP